MLMPQLRHSIKTDAVKNRGLKDILSPTAKAIEVISVEKLDYHVYNTKTVAIIEENGIQEERVLIYNRVDLRPAIALLNLGETTLQNIINDLVDLGYDVTEDDVDFNSETTIVSVVPTSLGFYEGEVELGACMNQRFFKVNLRGEDKSQSFVEVVNELKDLFVNLTDPNRTDLTITAAKEDRYDSDVYMYSIIRVQLEVGDTEDSGLPMSCEINLLISSDIATEWSEIIPGPDIATNLTDYQVVEVFTSPTTVTINRCFITFYDNA